MNAYALLDDRRGHEPESELRRLLPDLDRLDAAEIARRLKERLPGPGTSTSEEGAESGAFASPARLAELVNLLALEPDVPCEAIVELVGFVAKESGQDPVDLRLEVGQRALRDPAVLGRLPRVAVPAQLRVLAALTAAKGVSLWRLQPEDGLQPVWTLHDDVDDLARARAHAVLSGRSPGEGEVASLPVYRGGRPAAALLVEATDAKPVAQLAQDACRTLGLLLEREALLARNEAAERALVQASERRMVRLGFDLHDGAIQDVAALAGDIRLFREQLAPLLGGHEHEGVVLGRVDDLLARLYSLDDDLRRLVRSFETPTTASRPLETVLQDELELFRARAEIEAALTVEGDFLDLTASQRIALLRVVQEALTNVREHSGATRVQVSAVRQGGYVHAEIRDDGCGFEVEETLSDAARRGRLGLLGMSERIRLLGGMFAIESREGGPTAVLVTLPEWRPGTREASRGGRPSEKDEARSRS